MTDYRTLIDADVWAFIDKTNSLYAQGDGEFTVACRRELYDEMCRHFSSSYPDGVSAENKTGDPTFSPLADSDLSGLPPTVVISAEFDPLASDGEAYCSRIVDAGGKAWWRQEAVLVHGYLRARHCAARARESFTRIVDAIRTLGRKEWTYPLLSTAHERVETPRAVVHPID